MLWCEYKHIYTYKMQQAEFYGPSLSYQWLCIGNILNMEWDPTSNSSITTAPSSFFVSIIYSTLLNLERKLVPLGIWVYSAYQRPISLVSMNF